MPDLYLIMSVLKCFNFIVFAVVRVQWSSFDLKVLGRAFSRFFQEQKRQDFQLISAAQDLYLQVR